MITALGLTNFLSYRKAKLELGEVTALVGPNASGKSNAVAALKLLRDIPLFGLPSALARRGGFDQLRHRSAGRPFDPAVLFEFQLDDRTESSFYELQLRSLAGGQYGVKRERGRVHTEEGDFFFESVKGRFSVEDRFFVTPGPSEVAGYETDGTHYFTRDKSEGAVADGQSALPLTSSFYGLHRLWETLRGLQIVEIDPAKVRDLQDPSPGRELEPDGGNSASVFEGLPMDRRQEVVDYLSAVVPGIIAIEPRHISNKLTLRFGQDVEGKQREFFANQMSDGTLRAFGIILALVQIKTPRLIVIEEPEIAIHLGALRTLVDLLQEHAAGVQILVTTHSSDIINALEIDDLRVVWSEGGSSHLAPVAEHSVHTVREGLITPGELLRSDALDPKRR